MERYSDYLYLWIGGEKLGAVGRDTEPVLNPATGQMLGDLPHASAADLDRAVESSFKAFKIWRETSAWERGKILKKAADLLRQRCEPISHLLTLEEGKTLPESRVEVLTAADLFEWFAEEGKRVYGRLIPSRVAGQRQSVLREPVGPVAAFAPWNFPAVNVARKVAASLAAGCSCVIKPSEETPVTGLAIAEALADAGLPAGVLNVVYGVPSMVSTHLIAAEPIRKITFTGSTVVGKHLARLAADGAKRMTLELGGHAPVIVCADADPEKVAQVSVPGKLRNAGQVCTSPTRYLVHETIHESFCAALASRMDKVRIGDGLDQKSEMGPLANARRSAAMEQFTADAVQKGAALRAGGNRGASNFGNFWRPTVLSDVPRDARIMSEEPFGPIVTVNQFSCVDEAIQAADDIPYGLAAYAFTDSTRDATAISDGLQCGLIGINTYVVAIPEVPAGGVKESGYGSEGGQEGVEPFLVTKYIAHASL